MQYIQALRNQFEAYLDQQAFRQEPQALYEPANYIMQMGGKRLRPLLVLLGYRLFDEDVSQALPAQSRDAGECPRGVVAEGGAIAEGTIDAKRAQ